MNMITSTTRKIARSHGKFYHIGTRNTSFLQVSKDLKRLGIKNFAFMLEIYDPSLVDIDPYSPNLTQDEVSRIMMECTKNLWYYLREICRIPTPGAGGVPFIANRGNIAQAWCILNGIDSWLCLPRQQGKTMSVLAIQAWAYSFGTTNANFIFINKDGDNAKANLGRLKDQIDLLPEYLRFEQLLEEDETTGKVKIVKAARNATSMSHPITKNKITIKSKATSYEAALSLARGLTAPFLHFDEPEFTNHIKTIIENSFSTFATAAKNSRQNHSLFARIFSCTPGDLDTKMGQEAQEILSNTCKWTEKLYDMSSNPYDPDNSEAHQYVKRNGTNGIVYIEYSYTQIGLDEKWLEMMSNSIGNPSTVKREILLQRLHGSSASPFAQEDIEYITSIIQSGNIKEVFLLDHFRLDVYEELDRAIPYIVGIDCSTGTLSDNNAITILNPYTVKPVAEFKCAYIGETLYEKLIIELVTKHIPRAIVAIERNSVGDGIIDHLMHSKISHNLYFDKDKDLLEYNIHKASSAESMLKKRAAEKKFYGVYTTGGSRADMFTILERHMCEFKENFVTENITKDIGGLVKKTSGKIEAGPGMHDDSIMSYLIALYVYYHGNNLPLFGFIKGSEEIKNQNSGMNRDGDFTSDAYDYLPSEVADAIIKQKDASKTTYEDLLARALAQSQSDSIKLGRANIVNSSIIATTPDNLIDDYDIGMGNISLSLFDDLNF